jgi:hypothetical protein
LLEEDGHRVLIQAWDFVAGSNWVKSMHDGTTKATRTIAVLSRAYLNSVYGQAEWQAAWKQDPGGEQRKLLVFRIENCDRPGLLAGVVGIDIFGVDETVATARVRPSIGAGIRGRAKPDGPPAFPGAGRAITTQPRFPGSLPSVFRVPPRNPTFVGRAEDLAEFAGVFASGSDVMVQTLHGIGGVGKSQLAVEYAHGFANRYDLVWWIASGEPATIPDSYAKLAAELGLEQPRDDEELQLRVHDALRQLRGWLLIFDNANNVDAVRPWVPSFPLPAGMSGHVVVTTRRAGFGVLGPVMELDVLARPASIELFRTRASGVDPDVAGEIADELGCLHLPWSRPRRTSAVAECRRSRT